VRITLVSIHVENQDRALAFYRDVLGFIPKVDIPMGAYVDAEHRRLRERGVEFTRAPSDAGPMRIAVFADTCGNLIQIHSRGQPRSP